MAQLRLAVVGLLLLTLAACATPFKADVSRFQSQLPAPAGQTFAIVAANPTDAGGIEFGHYAQYVAGGLMHFGYTQVADPSQAQLVVRFGYGVDNGRTHIESYGSYGSYWGGYGGYGRWGYRGFYGGGPWHYGWGDPWFDPGITSYTVYTSGISVIISDRASGKRLFEGKAQAISTSNQLQYLVPNLVQAMFTNFPGNSGESVRITIEPPDKTATDKSAPATSSPTPSAPATTAPASSAPAQSAPTT
jgi:hypothetical protein